MCTRASGGRLLARVHDPGRIRPRNETDLRAGARRLAPFLTCSACAGNAGGRVPYRARASRCNVAAPPAFGRALERGPTSTRSYADQQRSHAADAVEVLPASCLEREPVERALQAAREQN